MIVTSWALASFVRTVWVELLLLLLFTPTKNQTSFPKWKQWHNCSHILFQLTSLPLLWGRKFVFICKRKKSCLAGKMFQSVVTVGIHPQLMSFLSTVTFVLFPFCLISLIPLLSMQHAPLQGSTRSVRSRGPGAGPAGVEGGEDEGSAVGSLWGGSLL